MKNETKKNEQPKTATPKTATPKTATPKTATEEAKQSNPAGLGKVAKINECEKPEKRPQEKPEQKKADGKNEKKTQRKTDGETVEALIKRHAAEIAAYVASHASGETITTGEGVKLSVCALAGFADMRRRQKVEIIKRLDYDPDGEAAYWHERTRGKIVDMMCIAGGHAESEAQAFAMTPRRFASAWRKLAAAANK